MSANRIELTEEDHARIAVRVRRYIHSTVITASHIKRQALAGPLELVHDAMVSHSRVADSPWETRMTRFTSMVARDHFIDDLFRAFSPHLLVREALDCSASDRSNSQS